jgi:hypothetical protein
MPGTHDITIVQGATFKITVSAKDAANNNVLALATSAAAQLRELPESSTVLADFDCDLTANNAGITVSLTPAQTANLSIRRMYWDLKVVWPDREEYLLEGKAILNTTVTR